MKTAFRIFMILIVCIGFAGCRKAVQSDELPAAPSTEKTAENNNHTEKQPEQPIGGVLGLLAEVDENIWKETSDIILKGRVVEIGEPFFTNPTGELIMNDGITPVTNAYATRYVVEVDHVYKGKWSEKTITVQANNRLYMTMEQALQGEDPVNFFADVKMEKGECIIGVCLFTAGTYGEEPFYELAYGNAGYFVPQGNGTYYNKSKFNHFSIDPVKLFGNQ